MPAPSAPPNAAAPRRRPPWWAVLGGLAAVLWLHGVVIEALAPARPPRPGDSGRLAAVVQVRSLAAAPARAATEVPAGPVMPPKRPPAPVPAPDHALPASPRPGPAEPVAEVIAAEVAGLAAAVAIDNGEAAADAGDPPPVYPTRPPPPVLLRYQLHYNGQPGEATLAWRHDGQRYSLQLDGRGAARPLVEQASQGAFDAHGLAPERFTDRRRGRGWQAAHFRRDTGRISFSGPQLDYPAWPGAQDRLSWLAQFAAIQAAAPFPLPAVRLFVVDARGAGGLWQFQPQGEVLLDTPLGALPAQHWRREPPRPEGLRVDAWLDASRGHWPLQLRFTALRSGDVFELRLAAEPLPP